MSAMKPDEYELIDRLTTALAETEKLLRKYDGAEGWAKDVGEYLRAIQNRDPAGLIGLRGAFGTMGALNDLVICPENGHRIAKDDVQPVNERLQELVHDLRSLSRRVTKPMVQRIK